MKNLNDFYRDKTWLLFRLSVINDRLTESGEIICAHCGKPIVKSYDIIAHHNVALTERNYKDVEISLNPDNISLVHHVCHNNIHSKLGKTYKEVYLVYGAPLSGKSTYIKDVMEYGDLIIDMDNIWQCISGCDRYIKPSRLTENVFGIRNALIEMIKMRQGNWNNAYIIGGYPLIGERERLGKMLGAKDIFIECSYDECLLRLKGCNDGRKYSEWSKYIEDWFSKYAPRS